MISIVIPALDEALALPATLDAALAQPHLAEVLVVDGDSRDRTAAIAAARRGVRVLRAPRGRASQMNAGAREARGEWLLFLHADTILPPEATGLIAGLGRDVQAGCFRQAFDAGRPMLAAISWLHNERCRRTHVMYGDQAMFVRREAFLAAGGFPAVDELEDVLLSERLRQSAPPVLLEATVVTSARRFLAQGVFRSFLRVLAILLQHELGMRAALGRRFFDPVR